MYASKRRPDSFFDYFFIENRKKLVLSAFFKFFEIFFLQKNELKDNAFMHFEQGKSKIVIDPRFPPIFSEKK